MHSGRLPATERTRSGDTLARLDDPDMGDWSYQYDALGNLTRQSDAKNQHTCLYYDGLNRLKGKNYRSDLNCPADPGYPNYTTAYYYDEGGAAVFEIGRRTRMMDVSGSTSWDYDARGRMISETKAITGGRTNEVMYKPWGSDRYSYGAVTTYKFTGQREEVSLGLYYYGGRWYDAALGRFVQADTIVPGEVQGNDRYAYVFNNPLRHIDPSGHNPKCGPDGVWCNSDSTDDYHYFPMPGSYAPPIPWINPVEHMVVGQVGIGSKIWEMGKLIILELT